MKRLPETKDLIRDQWRVTRAWLGDTAVQAAFDEPSILAGWTVRDLAVHLGRSFATLASVRPAPYAEPQTLLSYVASYPAAADDIAEGTRDLAQALADDVLGGIDELATHGLRAMDTLDSRVVLGPRGPIAQPDFLVTRLLELVVHSDDLSRSVPEVEPITLVPQCVERVSAALAAAYRERAGTAPRVDGTLRWLCQAAGRTSSEDPHLPRFVAGVWRGSRGDGRQTSCVAMTCVLIRRLRLSCRRCGGPRRPTAAASWRCWTDARARPSSIASAAACTSGPSRSSPTA